MAGPVWPGTRLAGHGLAGHGRASGCGNMFSVRRSPRLPRRRARLVPVHREAALAGGGKRVLRWPSRPRPPASPPQARRRGPAQARRRGPAARTLRPATTCPGVPSAGYDAPPR